MLILSLPSFCDALKGEGKNGVENGKKKRIIFFPILENKKGFNNPYSKKKKKKKTSLELRVT
jgi:hypothetical protein